MSEQAYEPPQEEVNRVAAVMCRVSARGPQRPCYQCRDSATRLLVALHDGILHLPLTQEIPR